jgi:glycosyltransferase involved in cell wall biosynthesis
MNLASALVTAGHHVVLWSADFYHQEKRHRTGESAIIRVSEGLEIRLIRSPGYGRNIGPGRLYDHAVLARNLKSLLRDELTLPDVGFVGYPPIETAAVMTRWLSVRGIPSLLDVKDKWPSLFLDPLPSPLRPLGRAILSPYYHLARRAMREATGMTAMADSFLEWALKFAGRVRSSRDIVVPLTSAPAGVSPAAVAASRAWWDAMGVLDDGNPKVCFVGSHSRAFDFKPIAEAAAQIAELHPQCQFIICGRGECSGEWRGMIGHARNALFPGWIDHGKFNVLADRCLAMLAPYKNTDDFRLSLPNKIIDALFLGLPILSPLQGEVAGLIETDEVGLRYGSDADRSLTHCIDMLIKDSILQRRLSMNARAVYHERFTFERVYGGLVEHLERIASCSGSAW